ncbi:hypothetical protein Tco_0725161 [Tanacetum coccineum]|uniref:Uncharacterized protein n=1 Tax=Tanacetum coccineum TaxID=301880 RepID=A0ABQ4YEA4_9ASTR
MLGCFTDRSLRTVALSIELESKDPKEDPLALSDRDLEYELIGAYLTLDPEYEAAQKDSVHWSPSSRTALPEAELEVNGLTASLANN